jgi:hypothetical protein
VLLSYLTGIAKHIKNPILKDKLGWKLAAQILEARDGSLPGAVNQVLMDLGATYCALLGSGTLKDMLGWKLAAQILEARDGKLAGSSISSSDGALGATYCAPSDIFSVNDIHSGNYSNQQNRGKQF